MVWLVFPLAINGVHPFIHDHSGHNCEDGETTLITSDECPICDQVLAQFFTSGVEQPAFSSQLILVQWFVAISKPFLQPVTLLFHLRAPPQISTI